MLKERENLLIKNLIQKLPQSSVGADLFELLAIRVETDKNLLCKELNAGVQGHVKCLNELLNLYTTKDT